MTSLTQANVQLPTVPEELAKFILVGREKLQSVRAEIRAIDKLHLAEEVREQKRGEARMLSEALLDAEVRIGELLKKIPKAPGTRTDIQPTRSGADKLPETKAQAVIRLGFSQDQAERFEALASHPDCVEQVKAEARENDDLPTRTAVLSLIKYKEEKRQAEYRQIDEDGKLAQQFAKALGAIHQIPCDKESIAAICRGSAIIPKQENVASIARAIETLLLVQRGFERG